MKIKTLKLKSKNLEKQFVFYTKKLGFQILERSDNHFSIQVGHSILVFEKTDTEHYYHFAFNIPSFQIEEALSWAEKRVSILPFEGKKILDFVNWNAQAFYFFDEDRNIVEFITRKNLNHISSSVFSAQSILEISEMGLPSAHVGEAFQSLHSETMIEKYSGDLERFCAAGDEHGLFIIVNEAEKKWLPTELPAKNFPFEMEVEVDSQCFVIEQQKESLLVAQCKPL